MKKPLLIVWMEGKNLENALIRWEFGKKVNAYFLIGILEDVKQVLIDEIDSGEKWQTLISFLNKGCKE